MRVLLATITAGAVLLVPPMALDVTASAPAASSEGAQSADQSVVGTLEQIDAAAMQIVVATASGRLTFRVQNGATIRQGSKKLTPAALASHKGERVKVRYRESAGVRRAEWIVLAPGPARPQKSSQG